MGTSALGIIQKPKITGAERHLYFNSLGSCKLICDVQYKVL